MEDYETGAGWTAIVVFPIAWIATWLTYGMWGLLLGWIPALAIAIIAGLIWPVVLFGGCILVLYLTQL